MINREDFERTVLLSSNAEWDRALGALEKLAAIDLRTYRALLDIIDTAANSLPDVEWIQMRLIRARDAAAEGYAYR